MDVGIESCSRRLTELKVCKRGLEKVSPFLRIPKLIRLFIGFRIAKGISGI